MIEKSINTYDFFFEEIKNFKEKQKKQKQRGLNDYNMVNVVRKESAEVGMHSNIIFSLIDPNGSHYQGDLFLQLFIKNVLSFENDFGSNIIVEAEESTNENRRIDFTIKSSKYYIGIEMKINAKDLDNQILDYKKDLQDKAKNDLKQEVIIYYLTKNGKEATKNSHQGKIYKKISFEEHIYKWIENCQKEVQNITNLNEAFKNYKNIVEKITNKYKGNIMALEDELLKDKEKLEMAKDISEAYQKAIVKQKNKERVDFIDNLIIQMDTLINKIEVHHNYKNLWHAIDIKDTFLIRIFANDDDVTIQIADIDTSFSQIKKESKSIILKELQKIDNNFISGWDKVYAILNIKNSELNRFHFFDLISKIIKIKI